MAGSSGKSSEPDGWQRIAALAIFAAMTTAIVALTGSASAMVAVAPALVLLLSQLRAGGRNVSASRVVIVRNRPRRPLTSPGGAI